MKINVELDIFSGRPNPSWILENEEATEILKMLQGLPSKGSADMDALGYRGFILTIENGDKKEIVHIYPNLATANDEHEKDLSEQNDIEQKLLAIAKEKGYRKILEDLGVK